MEKSSSAITLPPKTLSNILELIKIMTGLKVINYISTMLSNASINFNFISEFQ